MKIKLQALQKASAELSAARARLLATGKQVKELKWRNEVGCDKLSTIFRV